MFGLWGTNTDAKSYGVYLQKTGRQVWTKPKKVKQTLGTKPAHKLTKAERYRRKIKSSVKGCAES